MNVTLVPPAPIVVRLSGTQGIAGVQPYIFTQATPLGVWLIEHKLRRYPGVTLADPSGNVVEADVNYVDENNIMVTFSIPFAGFAYLN